MAKSKIFVDIRISPSSGYIGVEKMFHERELEDEYIFFENTMKKFGQEKYESKEGFELVYILIEVKYDGRKKSIRQEDVLKSFEEQGLAINNGSSMFGGFYKPTEKLELIMEQNLTKRKTLAGVIS